MLLIQCGEIPLLYAFIHQSYSPKFNVQCGRFVVRSQQGYPLAPLWFT